VLVEELLNESMARYGIGDFQRSPARSASNNLIDRVTRCGHILRR
jgi:hypothetical protein